MEPISRVWDFKGLHVVSTTELCKVLGLTVSAAAIKGVCAPAAETPNGTFWHVDDVPFIAIGIASVLMRKAQALMAEKSSQGGGQAA